MKLTKMITLTLTAIIACTFCATIAMAQGHVVKKVESDSKGGKMMTFSAENSMLIPGLTAMISSADNKLKVDFIPPADQRDPAYKKIDIMQGDILMMLNGKRLKSIAQLRELYDGLEVGTEIKVGLMRGKNMVMASFPKADGSQMGGMVMQVTEDMEGGHDGTPGQVITKTMSFGGDENDNSMVPLMGLGIMLMNGEGNLIVGPKMQIQGMKVPETDLQPDDIVLAINDQTVKSGEEFSPIYEAIPEGNKVTLKIQRGEETLDVVFVKPSMGGMKIIRKSGK